MIVPSDGLLYFEANMTNVIYNIADIYHLNPLNFGGTIRMVKEGA